MDNLTVFDAEYRFMCIVWEKEPIKSTELVKLCQTEFGWKKSTTYSVIKRLAERGIIVNENAVVTSLVTRMQVQKYQSEQFLEKTFNNSLPSFITAFLQDKQITKEEADEIAEMIRRAAK